MRVRVAVVGVGGVARGDREDAGRRGGQPVAAEQPPRADDPLAEAGVEVDRAADVDLLGRVPGRRPEPRAVGLGALPAEGLLAGVDVAELRRRRDLAVAERQAARVDRGESARGEGREQGEEQPRSRRSARRGSLAQPHGFAARSARACPGALVSGSVRSCAVGRGRREREVTGMLRICDHPDCSTLTLGGYCPRHEPPQTKVRFPRGRPFPHRRDAGSGRGRSRRGAADRRVCPDRGRILRGWYLEPQRGRAPPPSSPGFLLGSELGGRRARRRSGRDRGADR